ncbi:hypothetical protein PsYK624_095170 [Phanerochaete sordida]|uniref:Uncharacterized protein n=1 Tax=Phanerochaete sordida TaxID=48140 RepID=A0A9P3LG42_9APHY|nr:hypothetical protein PsYK624_095170 [Phanerochaete sordida]
MKPSTLNQLRAQVIGPLPPCCGSSAAARTRARRRTCASCSRTPTSRSTRSTPRAAGRRCNTRSTPGTSPPRSCSFSAPTSTSTPRTRPDTPLPTSGTRPSKAPGPMRPAAATPRPTRRTRSTGSYVYGAWHCTPACPALHARVSHCDTKHII